MIGKAIKRIFADELGFSMSEMSVDMHLFDELQMDEGELESILTIIEDEYEIEFEKDELNDFESIGDIIRYVKDNI